MLGLMKFTQGLMTLESFLSGKKYSPVHRDLIHRACKQLNDEQFDILIEKILSKHKTLPTADQIKNLIKAQLYSQPVTGPLVEHEALSSHPLCNWCQDMGLTNVTISDGSEYYMVCDCAEGKNQYIAQKRHNDVPLPFYRQDQGYKRIPLNFEAYRPQNLTEIAEIIDRSPGSQKLKMHDLLKIKSSEYFLAVDPEKLKFKWAQPWSTRPSLSNPNISA